MEVRQVIERHHGEHVVFDVIVHVGVEEGEGRVQDHGVGVQPEVEDVFIKACVLSEGAEVVQEAAVKVRQNEKHRGQEAAQDQAKGKGGREDENENPTAEDYPLPLSFRDIGFVCRGDGSQGYHQNRLNFTPETALIPKTQER